MQILLRFLLFFCGITLFSSQNFTVTGTVNDFHDKSPLEDTKITLGEYSTHANKYGKFVIDDVKAGNYTITVVHPGCEVFTENIMVQKNLDLTINLEHHVKEIETVTIHGAHKSNGTLIIKTLDKANIDRNTTQNIGNALSQISGVTTLKSGNNIAKPVIHGLYGDRITILNNGVKLADQEWGVEHAPNVDINNFQHIDVVKGASALKYGSGAIGGVVVLEPEIFPKKDTLKGSTSLSGISNGRGIAFDIDLAKIWKNGWAAKINGGYKKLGDLETPEYGMMNSGMEMNSFNFTLQNNSYMQGVSLDYYVTDQNLGINRNSDTGNPNDFYTAVTSGVPIYQRNFSYSIDNPRQEIQHHIAKISAFKRFKNLGKISVDYDFQYNHRKEFDVRRGELYNIPALDLELYTNHLSLNDLLERRNWSLETGLDLGYQYNYSTTETQAKRLIPNYSKYWGGVYSIFKYRFPPKLRSEIAARYDYQHYNVKMWYDLSEWEDRYAKQFPEYYVKTIENRVFTNPLLNFQNFSYNAGLEYAPSKTFNFKINYSKVSRTPNIAELFADGLHHSAAIIEVGDMALKNENGNQFNLNIEGKFDVLKGLNISVNPYLFITKNFITQIPTGIQNTIRGVFTVWSYKQIDAKMFGIDIDADWKLSEKLNYRGKFAYIYGQNLTDNVPLILMMPPNFSNSLEFQPDWKNTYLKIENQYVFHQNRFPVYNQSISIFENGAEVQKTLDLSTPPPSYSLWNFQAGMRFSRNFSADFSVSNLFDKKYKDYLNRMRYFSYEMGRSFIITMKYNF